MADQSDVETALAALITATLYPSGASAPSVLGTMIRVFRGWPNQAALDADLAAGRINVTVFPEANRQRNTTRYPAEYTVTTAVTPALTVSFSGESVTFAGTASLGQIAGVLADQVAVVHRTAAGDTPELVAAILAADLRTFRIADVAGATITVPGVRLLLGRVVADQSARMEVRRQLQGFRVTCWCPDPATRDACASTIDAALAAQTFITLPDGTGGRLRFAASTVFDQSQDAALYRRDLLYTVDYATTLTTTLPALIFGNITIAPNGADVVRSLIY
jgi:hypothetical protein